MRTWILFVAATAMAAPAIKWTNVPLSFEPNVGQASSEVRYLAKGSSYTLFLSSGETVVTRNGSLLRTRLTGVSPSARVAGEVPQHSTTNYFIGKDPAQWRTSVPNFARVRYSGVYPGIDLVYYGQEGHLEYDWIVSPGADPQKIRMTFEHADQLQIDQQGDLVIRAGGSEYRHKKPLIYQEVAGERVPVPGGWKVHGNQGSFRLGSYDRRRALVIDPPLIYSSYFGGTGADYGYAVAIDSIGNTYVAGGTGSTSFHIKGVEDAFVLKLSPSGSKMFSAFLGGGAADEAHGIAVDIQGNSYVTGNTGSLDFPTKDPIQATMAGSGDVFLAKLNASGSSLVYSTYLGGLSTDTASAVAVDAGGAPISLEALFQPTSQPRIRTKVRKAHRRMHSSRR